MRHSGLVLSLRTVSPYIGALILTAPLYAQTAEITSMVTDTAGALVQHAHVTIGEVDTNVVTSLEANTGGSYAAAGPLLSAGGGFGLSVHRKDRDHALCGYPPRGWISGFRWGRALRRSQ
jgi:hypothetical protein